MPIVLAQGYTRITARQALGNNAVRNGERTIYRRGKGYCGQYHVLTRDGTKQRRSVYGKTRQEAAEKLAAAIADRDRGHAFDAGTLTLSEYLDRYLDDARARLRPKPFNRAEGLVRNHVRPALGRVESGHRTPTSRRSRVPPSSTTTRATCPLRARRSSTTTRATCPLARVLP